MLLVDAKCTILPERREDFLRETKRIIPVVEKEDGCTRYELVADSADPKIFHFIEEWESQRHLDDHLARPHMQDYFARTTGCHAVPIHLIVYTVLSAQQVRL
ncbi:putative quinol monooxygenase [Methanoregula sp.]|uniref:putative quinol monooxygenase n=1 Tax=Methanoregula sp. TaxID=2052170 RepID=UPI002D181214|nr:putative quinol monooxygenase [Methanoregula sp.]HVP97594.1 putative quinol monooxygenase [Methanoregula sp.]